MKILHLTPHLGGGVGRALKALVQYSDKAIQREIICLEIPEKKAILEDLIAHGCRVFVEPNSEKIKELIGGADIVQIEWWNHPILIKFLTSISHIKFRLVIWSHVSGLHTPIIPTELIEVSDSFVFTSKSSLKNNDLKKLSLINKSKLKVISSSGGFDDFSYLNRNLSSFKIGYIGTLSFSKLHPDFINFLSVIEKEDLPVKLVGDIQNKEILLGQCKKRKLKNLINFLDFVDPISKIHPDIDVLVYFLNPFHYGTTENALIEAMSSGIVPIVINNPTEMGIVKNKKTGLVVKTPKDFYDAIRWLKDNPKERLKMSRAASRFVRASFNPKKSAQLFNNIYLELILNDKKTVNFSYVFGSEPSNWFLKFQKHANFFNSNGTIKSFSDYEKFCILEQKKGSIFHFYSYFPSDNKLETWVDIVKKCK